MQTQIERAINQVALRPNYLQYIELVKCLKLLGIIRQNYEQDLDQQSILQIQKLWNEAGGQNKLLVESDQVIRLISAQYPEKMQTDFNRSKTQQHQASLSQCSSTTKLNLTLKSRHNTSTRSIFDWSAADKENVPSNTMNNYVARRVLKICSDFKQTSQKPKITPLCLRHLKKEK